ncbi:hypothetical protein [Paracoccus saliphilus]|uniref:Uncharacterized protein n=1 Tax=Paracoccus saliphilus TaxID=405559 RepID=A0AA45W2Z2_9RHOB|nr:hypothetical protein [Paracoccus saliphilus]WCR04995.1 hypothetical protein JHX88_09935 [Paracoccus saliphilus]SIS71565.1 hypothetical protein SAMN05421772_103215 [Paracoccus saliphilus]
MTAEEVAAEDAALTAETTAQLAFLESARAAGDLDRVLELMGRAIEPGDDPRLTMGLAALRRISASSLI